MSDEIKQGEIEATEEKTDAQESPESNTDASTPEADAREVNFEEALEAILFAAGHPISYATLARVFELTPSKVKEKVIEYSLIYNNSEIPRGVILLTYADSCQLCTKKYYLNEIRETLGIKKSGTLSTSSLEALAIIAYNQPVTRVFVDTLRRADSSYAMNNLLDRGLIESKGRLDAPGRPMLYGTTTDFLRAFGLKDLASLPKTTEEIEAMFAKVNNVEEKDEEAPEQTEIDFNDDSDKISEGELKEAKEEALTEGDDTAEDFDEGSAEDNLINED